MGGTYHMRVYMFTHRYIQTQESERQGNKWDQPQSASKLPLNRNSRKRPVTSATLVNNLSLWPWRGPTVSPLPQNPLLVHLGEANPHLLRARLLPPQSISWESWRRWPTYRFWDCFCKTVSRAEARAGPLASTDVAHNAKSPRQQETLPAPFCYDLLLFN